jgi:hypothetical protein
LKGGSQFCGDQRSRLLGAEIVESSQEAASRNIAESMPVLAPNRRIAKVLEMRAECFDPHNVVVARCASIVQVGHADFVNWEAERAEDVHGILEKGSNLAVHSHRIHIRRTQAQP